MPANEARVFVRLLDWRPGVVDGSMELSLEWRLLRAADGGGTRKGGKFLFTVATIRNREDLARSAVEGLVGELNAMFPTASFRDREVLLWGA